MEASLNNSLSDTFIIRFITEKKWRVLRHACFIVSFGVLVFNPNNVFSEPVASITGVIDMAFIFAIIYFNAYFLFPRLLAKGKYIYYLFSILLLIAASFSIKYVVEFIFHDYIIAPRLPKDGDLKYVFRVIYFFPWMFAATIAIKLFLNWTAATQHVTELKQQNLQAELTHLKSQINPHFLFNTLNNINTLTHNNPQKASDVILKLSALLRYQLYDSTQERISLQSDLLFLENFLNIEKIRRDQFHHELHTTGNPLGIQLPPFLFIPFVENAIKHSVDPMRPSYVRIHFIIAAEQLIFECENSISTIKRTGFETGGIGLSNIRRRLELLYAQQYELVVKEETDNYFVRLTLSL